MGFKGGIIGGAIAGIAVGILDLVVARARSGIWEPYCIARLGELYPPPLYGIMTATISGIVLGAIYSRLYPSIPGETVTKGVYYGLFVWIIADMAGFGLFVWIIQDIAYGPYIFSPFVYAIIRLSMWLVYGAMLGAVFEKLK